MKDRKGFTLIELLVAITIIAIIMIMTLPAIHNLQIRNQEKKFDDYERTVLEAAKVYEDQYEEDLFGRNDTGCSSIDYQTLIQKKLLTTTKIAGYECNYSGNDNGIIIRKVNGTSYYEIYLTCKGKDEKSLTDNFDYTNIKNNHCVVGEDREPPELEINCDGEGETPAKGVEGDDFEATGIYYYSYTNSENKDEKRLPKLTAQVSDNKSGLEKNQFITYEWKIYKDDREQEEERPNLTEKNRTTFNIKDGTGSTSKKNVRIIEDFKEKDKTGKAIVDIRGENIVDRIGNKLDPNEKIIQCPYYFDNVKPKITITLTGASGRNYNIDGDDWINEPITTKVTVTDIATNNIYSGIKTDTFTRNGGNETLTGGTQTYTFSRTDYNRKEVDTYYVCDKVGNCYSDTVNIRVDTTLPICTSSGGDPYWRNTALTITGACTDNLSGCVQDTYTKEYPSEISITDGYAGRACDNARNCTDCSKDQHVHIDMTNPSCEFIEIGNENNPNTNVIFQVKCTDNDDLWYCGHDEAGSFPWTDNVHKTMIHTMTYGDGTLGQNVIDSAGNSSRCEITIEESRCTSNCCGTHDCGGCNEDGSGCDQCPDTCTDGECCGYHVTSQSSGLSAVGVGGSAAGGNIPGRNRH